MINNGVQVIMIKGRVQDKALIGDFFSIPQTNIIVSARKNDIIKSSALYFHTSDCGMNVSQILPNLIRLLKIWRNSVLQKQQLYRTGKSIYEHLLELTWR